MSIRTIRVLALAAVLLAGNSWADLPFEVIALSGQHAPGFAAGENYSIFAAAGNNAVGQVAFIGLASGVAITFSNDGAIFAGDPSAPSLVAREGDAAPTSGGELYQFLSMPTINAAGTVVFRSTLNPSGVGVFRLVTGGSTQQLVRNGSPVDNTATVLVGTTVFGNAMPADADGNGYAICDLSGASVTPGNNYAVLRCGLGGAATVARTGITVPAGVPDQMPAIRFSTFSYVNANAFGQVAFIALLTNSASDEDTGCWFWNNGTESLVARESGSAPGLAGVTFGQLGSAVGLGADGTVGFCAILAGAGVTTDNQESVWAGKPGALKLIAREGDAAPGLDAGVVFDSFVMPSYGDIGPAISPNGRAGFLARVRGPGITDANNDSLWVQDGDGKLRLVVREGTLIPSGNSTDSGLSTSDPSFLPITLSPVGAFSEATKLIFSAESSNGSFDGIYQADVPPATPDTVAPTVKVKGSKVRKTESKTIRLTGTATDNVAVARVEYQQGKRSYRPAAGTDKWQARLRLKTGRNVVRIRSVDTSENKSPLVRVVIRRSAP